MTIRHLIASSNVQTDRVQGVLELQNENGSVRLSYREGKIVSVDTDTETLTLYSTLASEGSLRVDLLEKATAHAVEYDSDFGSALVALGILAPNVYFDKLTAWATTLIGQICLIKFTNVNFEETVVKPPPLPLGFDRYGILFEAIRRGLTAHELEDHLASINEVTLRTCPREGFSIEDAKPKPRELRVINAIDGSKNLNQLLTEFGGNDERNRDVLRAIFFAVEACLVESVATEQNSTDLKKQNQYQQELEGFKKQNYFEILGISVSSSDDAVHQQYVTLAKRYHPDNSDAKASPEMPQIFSSIFALINEAYEATKTHDKRKSYDKALKNGLKNPQEEQQHIENVINAEKLYEKADALLRMRKYAEGLSHIEEALKLQPNDIEFKVLRAYLKYFEQIKTIGATNAAQNAIQEISEYLRQDNNIASGYLYLGFLYRSIQNMKIALKYFKRVLEFQPTHTEALREIRLAENRAQKEKKRGTWF